MLATISSWASTLSLVFGGCCANALTLEQLTSIYPSFGTLITFLQFVLIALHGLPNHITWTAYGPRFKPRRIPLMPYIGQVALFYLISMLNNAAFAYHIPMAVHIIFRSGGLVVSMLLGWLVSKKKYTLIQVLSVLLVTVGVGLTTLSASHPSSKISASSSTPADPYRYATGISILSLALVFSGFLGLLQDWTYTKYGRPSAAPPPVPTSKGSKEKAPSPPATWTESMFYLHFLGLPFFWPLLPDIRRQIATINYHTPRAVFTAPLPLLNSLEAFFPSTLSIPPPNRVPSFDSLIPESLRNNDFVYFSPVPSASSNAVADCAGSIASGTDGCIPPHVSLVVSLPKPYLPLLLNTITQLLCVAGVHRLTTRVSSLTVTLILVVRKAVSLVISLKGRLLVERIASLCAIGRLTQRFGGLQTVGNVLKALLGLDADGTGQGKRKASAEVNETMLWTGAGLVLLGTIGYAIGTGRKNQMEKGQKAKKE